MSKHFTVPASVVALLASEVPANLLVFAEFVDTVVAAHRDRQQALMDSQTAVLARAEAENRDLTQQEQSEIDGLANEFDDLERQIGLRERVNAQQAVLTAPRGRQTDPDESVEPAEGERPRASAQSPSRSSPQRAPAAPRVTAGGTGGFRHLGEFAHAVRAARGGDVDPRLRNAALTTYGNESSGADGGFAVPPDYRSEILSKVFNEDTLLSRTDRLQSSSNTITLPTDETTPWQTSGGIQAYWVAEAGVKPQSKIALGETTLKLHTLACLVPVTDELLEDAPAMGAYLNRKAPEKMEFKVSDAIVRGTGVGMPLGFLNSPALVTVAAEGGQTADTLNVDNVMKMWARMPTASRRTAIWIMHPDAEGQLPKMTVGNQPIYMPAGGLSQLGYGTLFGRPVIPHQVARTLGDVGDVMLVDLSQYLTVTKTGNGRDANGIRQDVSIHLWFDQDTTAFRFTMRIAGQPWWAAAISQASGANAQSPYIALAAR